MQLRVLLLLASLGLANSSFAEFQPIRIGYVDFPPFTYKHKGEPAGFLFDEANRLLAQVGLVTASTELLPAARLFKSLKCGAMDMWFGIELHQDKVAYTKLQLATLELDVWVPQGQKMPVIRTVEDLKPYRLALLGGYGYGEWGEAIREAHSDYKWIDLSDRHQAFKFLTSGRADILLDYKDPLLLSLSPEQVRELQQQKVQELPVKIGVSKHYPQYAELIAALDKQLARNLAQRTISADSPDKSTR